MSEQTPYQTLGISEEATFEDIQAVKLRLLQENEGNTQLLDKVEAAYDAIIMERLRLRQEGKISVPETIRFPDRQVEARRPPPKISLPPTPSWMENWLDTPSRNDVLLPAGVFSVLVVISWLSQDTTDSLRSLLLVVGVFATIFFLNRKEKKFGRALLLSLGALLLGIGAGSSLVYLLQNANVTVGFNTEQVSSTITFILLWLISSFIR